MDRLKYLIDMEFTSLTKIKEAIIQCLDIEIEEENITNISLYYPIKKRKISMSEVFFLKYEEIVITVFYEKTEKGKIKIKDIFDTAKR